MKFCRRRGLRKFLKPKGWDNLLRYSAEAVTCTLCAQVTAINQTISCSFKYLPTTFEKSLILRI